MAIGTEFSLHAKLAEISVFYLGENHTVISYPLFMRFFSEDASNANKTSVSL